MKKQEHNIKAAVSNQNKQQAFEQHLKYGYNNVSSDPFTFNRSNLIKEFIDIEIE
jgi:hypothetical protein